jgi:C_GCAxxG_C_C family probable redox protein
VLAGFSRRYGLPQDQALTVARAFGSGMGLGNMCGAVTGAFMVLGFKHRGEEHERQARLKTYDLVREFVKRFEAEHHTIVCRELLGVDVSKEGGMQEAMARNLFAELCPRYVRSAAAILQDLLGT